MKKSGFAKATLGFILGLSIGLGVLTFKAYLADQLIHLIDDEVTASCSGCRFDVDSVSISLLRLTATARNPRIVQNGKDALRFDRIVVHAGLQRLSERVVLLNELHLYGGKASGVGPDSPTFQFIDHLTAPIPPERDHPDRWRARLEELTLHESSFFEPFTRSDLVAEGVTMGVARDEKDNFWLQPAIKTLKVVSKKRPNEPSFELGGASAKIYLDENNATFHGLKLAHRNGIVTGEAVSHTEEDNRLEGQLEFELPFSSYALPDWLDLELSGIGKLGGSLGRPSIHGSFHRSENGLAQIITAGIPRATFDSLDGDFEVHVRPGESEMLVTRLKGEGPGARVTLTSPLRWKNEDVEGAFSFSAETLTFEDGTFHGVTGDIVLSGTDEDLKTAIRGKSEAVVTHGFTFFDVGLSLALRNDLLDLEFTHQSPLYGSFNARGKIALDQDAQRIIGIDYQFANFALFQPEWPRSPRSAFLQSLRFSGAGAIQGPLDVRSVESSASFLLSSTTLLTDPTFQGKADVQSGVLKVNVEDKGKSLNFALTIPLSEAKKSHLKAQAVHLRPEDLFPSLECLDVSGEMDYSFEPASPWLGSGVIKLQSLQFGCAPYTVSLEQPIPLKVTDGNAVLPPASFTGTGSAMLVQGDVSAAKGFNVRAQGRLELNSLVALLPSFDDLSGHLIAALDITGPVEEPFVRGTASIGKGEFSVEAANLSASDISGALRLAGRTIRIEDLTGKLNGGSISLRGEWLPFEPEKSTLTLSGRGIALDPFENTTLELGGDLELKEPASGIPSIEGVVHVEGGEFQKNLEVANLVRALSDFFFKRSPQVEQNRMLPRVDLNISVSATRNLFMYTNWAGAEFRGDLQVRGDINAPEINGAIETIAGWFGIRDRRFEITSGTLAFKNGASQPVLEIIGETYVPSYTGDSILIIAEARGPLSAPKITFSSDRGLSEREILNLLAIGGTSGGQTLANTAARDLELQGETLFDERSLFNLPHILSNLTTINSLTFQPTYNVQTGLIEPSIVAEKRITDSLSLLGESTFDSAAGASRLKLLYDLTPYLKIAGIAESLSTRQTSALGVDVTYTVLAKQREFVKIETRGNKRVDRLRILRGIRLTANSRVPVSDVPRLERAVEDFYRSLGYLEAHILASCDADSTLCRSIVFDIEEGPLYYVRDVVLEGDSLPSSIDTKRITSASSKLVASERTLEQRRSGLINRLRSEGYISARVTASYQASPDQARAQLALNVQAGKPVSFVFRGNERFTAEEFLETINLFERKQPFGNNTINILVQNIERKYREAGYLYATISYNKSEDRESGRITYSIEIFEDAPTTVREVRFVGNAALTESKMKDFAGEVSVAPVEQLFSPRYAVAEEIEENVRLLRDLYIEQGYPQATVSYRIIPIPDSPYVDIEYQISEGEEVRADWLHLEGFPAGLEAPEPPVAPYSIPRANRYIDQLLETLKTRGYFRPELWSELAPESQQMIIHIEPGVRTLIDSIIVEGNEGTDNVVIERNLVVRPGGPWDGDAINETKRKLLRLGLYSRVEIEAADGAIDTERETMIVRVSERPLTTLEVGTGANSEFGLHLFGEATDRDFFRDGRALTLRADLYYDPSEQDISQGVAGLRYSDPAFLESNFSLAEELRFERIDLATLEYDLNRVSLASYVYRAWDSGLTGSFGHTILSDDISSVSEDAILSDLDRGFVTISFLSAVFGFDRRDNPLSPTKGYNLNFDTRLASKAILSDADYFSVGARASYIAPVPATRVSFAFGARAASAWTFGGTEEIPITQRYYLGGRNSVRGFRENSLGPRGEAGSVLGGDSLLLGSVESRYLLTDYWTTHLFFDAGNVFLRGDDATSYSLRYSAGVGMRFLSPIGPIGFDIGRPLNEKSGEPSIRFHFSIGTNF